MHHARHHSDWSGDAWLDLIVGNDFDIPDFYYRGDGKGGFERIERGEGVIPRSTHLTMSVDTGDFDNTDEAERAGVGFTGWSWNARFADVDNDEWQDIFVVAGSWFRATPSGTTANFFFHNEAGKRFSDQNDAFGLQNIMIVSAYTVVDFDRDGDLDFVTNSTNGPLWLLRNNERRAPPATRAESQWRLSFL